VPFPSGGGGGQGGGNASLRTGGPVAVDELDLGVDLARTAHCSPSVTD